MTNPVVWSHHLFITSDRDSESDPHSPKTGIIDIVLFLYFLFKLRAALEARRRPIRRLRCALQNPL